MKNILHKIKGYYGPKKVNIHVAVNSFEDYYDNDWVDFYLTDDAYI